MKDIAPAISPPAGIGDLKPANQAVLDWVQDVAKLTQPENIFWCDGSERENDYLLGEAGRQDVLIKLKDEKVPRSYLHRSNPNDVARVEQFTFICTPTKREAGPTNNWSDPAEMYTKLHQMLKGAMRGRTMFVIPYIMGPPDSPLTKVGFEITDSIYVVLSMRIMTRMGDVAIKRLGDDQTEEWNRGVDSPEGRKHYVVATFPSACGKTNFAMLIPPKHFKGWKVTTVGDDIAWMQIRDGRLYAVNPENGYFGVVPGTSYKSNPNAMKSIAHDTIYTNVALTDDGDAWWEGKDGPRPAHAVDWRANDWTPKSKEKAAHPNSRFTTPMRNNAALDPDVEKGEGVPISAIIFGGRRSDTVPLVYQAFDWDHGVYLGATMASETTAAATGAVGQVRRDPMAMLPFCGYNIGDYFQHWLDIGKRLTNPPLIFNVNWFRKGVNGQFLWPGFGENMRVLKWIIDRCEGTGGAVKSPIGWLPGIHDVDLAELEIDHKCVDELLEIDHLQWEQELPGHKKFFDSLGGAVPEELERQRKEVVARFEL